MKLTNNCNQLSCFGSAVKRLGRKHHNLAAVVFLFLTLWLILQVNVLSIVDYSRLHKGIGYNGNSDAVLSLMKQNTSICNNSFVGYGEEFAVFRNIVLNPFKNVAFIKESVDKEWTAPKKMLFSTGYFSVSCTKRSEYQFRGENHLNEWYSVIHFQRNSNIEPIQVEQHLTIAVQRYEYANLFHSMTDFYNAFLMMKMFKGTPAKTNILLFDTHPKGLLFEIWYQLFNNVTMAKDIREPIKYKTLVWSITGYHSPLNFAGNTLVLSQIAFSIFNDWTPFWMYTNPLISYLSDFKKFFLGQYHIRDYKSLNCRNLSVLFIWRRDYVSHRGNPSGFISRKIKNENELLEKTRGILKGHHISGVQLDKLPIKEQLTRIATTDILIGMHGAALSFTLFLPDHAALLELYPRYWPTTNLHFRCMAQWRNLTYLSWQNTDHLYEKRHFYTYIPPIVLGGMVSQAQSKLCPHF